MREKCPLSWTRGCNTRKQPSSGDAGSPLPGVNSSDLVKAKQGRMSILRRDAHPGSLEAPWCHHGLASTCQLWLPAVVMSLGTPWSVLTVIFVFCWAWETAVVGLLRLLSPPAADERTFGDQSPLSHFDQGWTARI